VVVNHFAEGSQSQTYEFLESRTKNFTIRQLHVLFYCTNEVCYTKF